MEVLNMQNQNQQPQSQNTHQSGGITPNQMHGGHELMDAHESIGTVIGGIEQFQLFEQNVQDQKLSDMMMRHRSYMSQLYNTIIDTLKTGQDPEVPTQTYNM